MSKLLSMHQIRRIIELKQQGRGVRETVRLTGFSRNTVREYLKRIDASDFTMSQLLAMDNEALGCIVYVEPTEKGISGRTIDERYQALEPRLERYCSELRKRGVTRQLLWEENRQEFPQGYGYTQFCEYLRQHLNRKDAVMRLPHRPGEQLQVDFAGDKLGYVDMSTGEWISCEVLVCAMPYSHYVYAEALRSQKQEDFIKGLGGALKALGGVPPSIKCDNMRTVVTKAHRYEPTFTEAMEYMAAHYNTTILTARVRKPRDKASVEKAVDLVYKRVYAPLRGQTFHSLEELNVAIIKQTALFNLRPFKNKDGNRKQVFEAEEKPLLKELPSTIYQIKNVTQGKVQRNYHVIVGQDRHQYSVPHHLIGKHLKIVYTEDVVEIYDNLERVALHRRSYKKNDHTTLPEHMPDKHQHVHSQRGWNREYFEREASTVGPSTALVIKRVLDSKFFYEQTYTSCVGILRLGKRYGLQRLEAACKRAADAPLVNYGIISNILARNLDKADDAQSQVHTPSHNQIRGPQAFK